MEFFKIKYFNKYSCKVIQLRSIIFFKKLLNLIIILLNNLRTDKYSFKLSSLFKFKSLTNFNLALDIFGLKGNQG